ncbi:MAG: bifunctional pyr operon transcriptional regulator/uracil phosphoribosyltransferase PyrR [Deltaproteobacteria bacterium]|nr:bifunctional pyr operon transcriptional regulator/uracil phosphoribosyltransferase PyrR [Deltaproteobacteria bacterium]
MNQEKQVLLKAEEIQRIVSRMAHEIVEKSGDLHELALIGIRSRGAHLVRRLAKKIEEISGVAASVGDIDVTPYRDDVRKSDRALASPTPTIPISIEDKTVILVDDVIYTGRTVRAALDLLSQAGKSKRILLAILIDRGDRELPIKPDIVGKNVRADNSERVNVMLQESDGVDVVTLTESRPKRSLL